MKTFKIKAKFKALIMLFVVFSLSIVCLTLTANFTASAEIITITDYTDDFSSEELSKSWTEVNTTGQDVNLLENDNDCLLFDTDTTDWSWGVVCSKYKITKAFKVELITQADECDGWFAFYMGAISRSTSMPYAKAGFIMGENAGYLMLKDGNTLSDNIKANDETMFSPMTSNYYGQPMKTTFEFTGGTNDLYNLVYTVETLDGALVGTSSGFSQVNLPQNSYFGLNAAFGTRVSVISFKVFEGNEQKFGAASSKLYNESVDKMNLTLMSETSIKYLAAVNDDAEWFVANGFDKSTLNVARIAKLDVSTVGTGVVYNSKYQKSETKELEQLYTLSVDVLTENMGVGVATGFEFGKTDVQEKGVFAGITKDANGEFYLAYIDGAEKNKKAVSGEVDGQTLSLVVNYDNTATISVGNNSFSFSCRVAEGYFALTSVVFDGSASGQAGAKLDNFVYKHCGYKANNSKDVAINFEGTKQTYSEAQEEYMTSYYINAQDWRRSTDVIVPQYIETATNNSIMLPGSGSGSSFGPNYKYENFIVRFDVTFIDDLKNGASPKFGLQFGMAETLTSMTDSYFLGFQSSGGKTYVVSQNAKLSSGTNKEPLYSDADNLTQINIFAQNKTYNVMYIAQNGSVKVFLKEKTQDGSVAEIVRGELKNINNKQGYLQIIGMQGARLYLDNLSITNLNYNVSSSAYNGNGYDIVRADFTKGDKLDSFKLNKTQYKDDYLLVKKGGSINTNSNVKNHIFRFTTKSKGGDVIVEEGGLTIKISKTCDKLFVTHDNKTEEFNLQNKVNFDGALFEIYRMGNSVTVGYVNQNEPSSRIVSNQYSVTLNSSVDGVIKLYANDGALELYSVSVFDLKASINIAKRDYDPLIDDVDPWKEKPSIQELNSQTNNGCKSTIMGEYAFIALFCVLAVTFILRRKKHEKNIKNS